MRCEIEKKTVLKITTLCAQLLHFKTCERANKKVSEQDITLVLWHNCYCYFFHRLFDLKIEIQPKWLLELGTWIWCILEYMKPLITRSKSVFNQIKFIEQNTKL